jgi:hypothetical protein
MRSANVALALRVSKNLALARISASAERRAQRALSPSMNILHHSTERNHINSNVENHTFVSYLNKRRATGEAVKNLLDADATLLFQNISTLKQLLNFNKSTGEALQCFSNIQDPLTTSIVLPRLI